MSAKIENETLYDLNDWDILSIFEREKVINKLIKDFTEMPVWQKAMDIAERCFHISDNLPKKEDYALTSQLRRSAQSISANIAEGFGRRTAKDKSRFYDISRGSAFETKSHLIYGNRVKYFSEQECLEIQKLIGEVVHDLNKITNRLNSGQP